MFGSPSTRRKIYQSPLPIIDSTEPTMFRTPPSTPFQPGFYKKPPIEEPQVNPFPMSPRSSRKIVTTKSSDSLASSSSSSITRKMRRKKREAQRMAGDESDSDEECIQDDVYRATPASAVEIIDPEDATGEL
jgi:hypothetical protein